ncbi:Uncharacterised protein [uncultured archaeon]|nr:Uncharacterised protein [uncultured archaeon]
MMVYGRLLHFDRICTFALFATTNPWVFARETAKTREDIGRIEANASVDLRKLAKESDVDGLEETIVLAGDCTADPYGNISEFTRVGHVGEFVHPMDALYFVTRGINALVTRNTRKYAKEAEREMFDKFVKPLSDAVQSGNSMGVSNLQSKLMEAYQDVPIKRYAQELCGAIIAKDEDLIKDYVKLITAIQSGNYETAAIMDRKIQRKLTGQPRAQGI